MPAGMSGFEDDGGTAAGIVLPEEVPGPRACGEGGKRGVRMGKRCVGDDRLVRWGVGGG